MPGSPRGLGDVILNWGSTEEERGEAFACDRYLEQPDTTVYRAVPVDANLHTTYLWLCQLRVAPYSYDSIDNGGRPSPRTRDPALERLEIGQRFMTIFRLVNFVADREVTVLHRGPLFGEAAATYRVVDRDDSHCRIVVKMVLRYPLRSLRRPLMRLLLPAGDLLMMRRQLLNLADFAAREWRGDRPGSTLPGTP